MAYNDEDADGIRLDIFQGNSAFCEDNDFIGTLEYAYGRTVPAREGVITIQVDVDRSGLLTISAKEPGMEPVIQQLKV
jgi:molecular chaperone DnaK (HSP70)